jgi:hypothetical protein
MPLDLLVPDLLPSPDAPPALRDARWPALEKWLARAERVRKPGGGALRELLSLFGVGEPAPYAALSLAGETEAPAFAGATWLRADPVHLRVDHDYLRLHDASVLEVTREEADALVASLQAHFAGDGLEFRAVTPGRWYVRVPVGAIPRTTPLPDAIGRDVFGMLPEAGGALNWRSAITEAQMMMGAHEVNARREAAGKPAINSVWFWGEGVAPTSIERRFARVYANDAIARGLGALSGAEVCPAPARLADVDPANGAVLVVLDSPPGGHWFESLGEAIGKFGTVRLILPAGTETLVATLTPAARWRWFRSRKSLADA